MLKEIITLDFMCPGFSPEISRTPEPEIPPDMLVPEHVPPEPKDKKGKPDPVDLGERFAADEEQWFEQGNKGEAEEFKAPKFSVEEEEWFEQGKTGETEDFTAPEEESAEEAELRELEEESEIRRVRNWAEREAASTQAPRQEKHVAKRGADIAAGASIGVLAKVLRVPGFLIKKLLGMAGNFLDKLQKDVGGPVGKALEKMKSSKEEK